MLRTPRELLEYVRARKRWYLLPILFACLLVGCADAKPKSRAKPPDAA